MNDEILYVPILKGKEGEFGALEELRQAAKKSISPFIEIPPIQERSSKSLQQQAESIADRLSKAWPERPFYLYGTGAARAVALCRRSGLRPVAVVDTKSSTNHLRAIREEISEEGLCLRLGSIDFDDDGTPQSRSTEERVQHVLEALDLQPQSVDVLLDLGELGSDFSRASLIARQMLGEVPFKEQW